MKFEWEEIYRTGGAFGEDGGCTSRAKAIGGWIVNNYWWDSEHKFYGESMVFISDPLHEWTIDA